MEKPETESSQGGILSCRRDRPSPPAVRIPERIAEMEDAESNRRQKDPEVRNLILGIGIAVLFGMVFFAALFLAGPEAPIVAAGSAAVSMIVLWIMSRTGVHRQPGGLFLSATAGGFVAMFVPLAAGLVAFLQSQQMERKNTLAESKAPPPASTPALLPRLTDSFEMESLDVEKEDYVRVIRNSTVAIDGRNYRIAMGELFPLHRVAEGEVIVKGRDFLISLPPDILQVVRKEPPAENVAAAVPAIAQQSAPEEKAVTSVESSSVDRAELTRIAQAEAIKRFPALGIEDTMENRTFLATYKRLRVSDSDLLKDPEWPLQLAEALAEREGWRRADIAPVSVPAGTVVAAAGIAIETTEKAPEFPPFDSTPPPFDESGESMPLPQ